MQTNIECRSSHPELFYEKGVLKININVNKVFATFYLTDSRGFTLAQFMVNFPRHIQDPHPGHILRQGPL